jgi:hypothetical protein
LLYNAKVMLLRDASFTLLFQLGCGNPRLYVLRLTPYPHHHQTLQ